MNLSPHSCAESASSVTRVPAIGDPVDRRSVRQRSPSRPPAQLAPRAHRSECHEPPPPRIAGRQPAVDRRAHDADRRRGRVPVLQRQQRAAVRADVRHQRGTAGNLGAAEGQRGADRGHARGDRQLADAAPGSRDGPYHRDRRTEARKGGRAAAGRHEGDRAVGVGDRAEVPGTGKGQLARRRSSRAPRSRPRRCANRWTSSLCSTCSTKRRGMRSRATRSTSATASPLGGWG